MSFYGEQILPRLIHVMTNTAEMKKLREQVFAQADGVVLEIGFGSGTSIPFYKKTVKKLMVVEPSATARKLALKAVQSAPFPVEFAGLDGEKLEVPDRSIDSVVSFLCLCTIPRVKTALSEIRRVLKPDGKFLFMEHGASPDDSVLRWQNRLNGIQNVICGGCNLNRPIADLVRNSKLKIESLENKYIPGAPRAFAYAYIGSAKPHA